MRRTRLVVGALLASLALVAAGCGGGEEGETTATASYEIGAMEFIEALAPEKIEILREYVASEPNQCGKVDQELLFAATIDATTVPAETPLAEVIADACG